ncbi:unnamed protein product [Schistosoma turkestanicum]|nr:unnamed protein product [Schistosoma turkestanicum]
MINFKQTLLVVMIISAIQTSETAVASGPHAFIPTTWGNNPYPVTYSASDHTPYAVVGQDPQTIIPSSKTKYINRYSIVRANVPSYSLVMQPNMNTDLKQPTYLVAQQPISSHSSITYPRDQQTQTAATNSGSDDEIEIMPKTMNQNSQYSDASIVGSPDDGVIGSSGGVLGSPQDVAVVESAGQSVYSGDMRQNQYIYPNVVPLNPRFYSPLMNPLRYQLDKRINTVQLGMNQYDQPLYGQVPTRAIPPSQYTNGLTGTSV